MQTFAFIESEAPRALPGKRLLDVVVAAALLVASAPLLVFSAAWIAWVSSGPILFTQPRVGYWGKTFSVLKLRTMSVSTERASTVTVRHDPRIIPGGHLLRKLKIDELPQLINVLCGEMSLVGPRPTVRADYELMTSEQKRRCLTPPGLTGLAQINGNTSLLWPERIEFDLRYLRDRSVWLDVCILAKTALLVFSGASHTDPPGESEWEVAA